MHYNISLGVEKNFYFLLKKIIQCRDGMGRGYPNPLGTGMGFNFSSPLGLSRVTSKYMRIKYRDEECKTHPHPAPLPCLIILHRHTKFQDLSMSFVTYFLFNLHYIIQCGFERHLIHHNFPSLMYDKFLTRA